MTARIFGLETEFGIVCFAERGRCLEAEEVARYLFKPVVSWGGSSNVFLANGSRLYLDVGSHPEYATAECDSVDQVIAHDRAGERIVSALVRNAQQAIADAGFVGTIHCFKNNVDCAGNSFGCHENYLIRRGIDFGCMTRALVPHLVSRQVVTGAGGLRTGTRGRSFCFSARAEHLWEAVSSATTRSRPMINTRDEPHADPEKYRRLHVISGDSNMSEASSALKLGQMDLLLRMLDAGVKLTQVAVTHPMQAIRTIAHDMTGTSRVELEDGRRVSGVEVQREILRQVEAFVGYAGATTTDERTLDLWRRGLDAVECGDHRLVARELDWAIKYEILSAFRRRHNLDWDDPNLARLDLAYHDIEPERGLYFKAVATGLVKRIIPAVAIDQAVEEPPATTRASLRGRFVAAARAARRDYSVDWLHLKLHDDATTVTLRDPFAVSHPDAERIIDQLLLAACGGTSSFALEVEET